MTFFHLVDEPYGFLSNWYYSPFVIDDRTFVCVEQYMMWSKAILFGDCQTASQIMNTSDPVKMKQLGRAVKDYKDSKWAAYRYAIVRDAIAAKFSQNKELKEMFLQTDGEFAECARNDFVWGIGIDMNDPERFNRRQWRGQNLLGYALQEVYNELKGE